MGSRNVDVEIGVGDLEEGRRDQINGGRAGGGGGAISGAVGMNQIASTPQAKAAAAALRLTAPVADFSSRLFKLLFILHLIVLAILITFLSISGFLAKRPSFHAVLWFSPLLTSAAASVLIACLWLLFVLYRPRRAIKASLWLAPLLACGAAMVLLADGSATCLAFAVVLLVLAAVLSLYACWITPRLSHAYQILSESTFAVRPTLDLAKYVAVALLAGLVYFSIWTLGVGGVAAGRFSRLAPLYVILLLLSLVWTMQVVKCVVYVATARLAYVKLACGLDADVGDAFSAAAGARLLGHVCYSAAAVSTAVAVWGMARAMELVAGESDEFLFSCTNCYVKVAEQVLSQANRWGLVYVGAYGEGLLRASTEVWGMFQKQGMEKLIDVDITGSFCFLCGTAGGAASAVIAGSWVLAAGKGHVAEVTIYAFFVGYFMSRIAMAWPQACVAAYHVVHAENPRSARQGSCIPERMRELQYSSD